MKTQETGQSKEEGVHVACHIFGRGTTSVQTVCVKNLIVRACWPFNDGAISNNSSNMHKWKVRPSKGLLRC